MKGLWFGSVLWLIAMTPGATHAQAGRVVTAENIRATPNGVLLGRLSSGLDITATETRGRWVQFTVEGWMWDRSLQAVSRQGFSLVVSSSGGENLRDAPSGEIIGSFEEGTLLSEVDRTTGWILVQRVVWIWSNSIELAEGPTGMGAASAAVWRSVGPEGNTILTSPDGDTLARTFPGSEVRMLAREGNWARIQIEGWTWLPEGEQGIGEEALDPNLTPEDVADGADEFRGRVVQWDLQFISLETAESVRTDFYEGEPFMLTRSIEGRELFVYVAIPPERQTELAGLSPLERIRVTGRVRTEAASLTGSPILELLELARR